MISRSINRPVVVAALFATALAIPDRQAIGGAPKRGDKPLKSIELSDDYTIPIVIKGQDGTP